MSAYIVSKSTMDLVVQAVINQIATTETAPTETATAIGRRLYRMNLDAVSQRYPGGTKEDAPGPGDISNIHDDYQFSPPAPDTAPEWTLPGYGPVDSALRELRYQCSEGDVPSTWADYQQIDDLCGPLKGEAGA